MALASSHYTEPTLFTPILKRMPTNRGLEPSHSTVLTILGVVLKFWMGAPKWGAPVCGTSRGKLYGQNRFGKKLVEHFNPAANGKEYIFICAGSFQESTLEEEESNFEAQGRKYAWGQSGRSSIFGHLTLQPVLRLILF
eukprot:1156843-Pelagomonas_calceolata.AAC.13